MLFCSSDRLRIGRIRGDFPIVEESGLAGLDNDGPKGLEARLADNTSFVVKRKLPRQKRLMPTVPSGWASTARSTPGRSRGLRGIQRTRMSVWP